MSPSPLVLATLALLAAAPAIAEDQKLTPEETGRAVGMLARQGFTSWGRITLHDGKIEVDDAVHDNGKQFDLTLDPESLEILERKPE